MHYNASRGFLPYAPFQAAPAPKVVFAGPGKTDAKYGALAPAKSPTPPPNPLQRHRQINLGAAMLALLMPTSLFLLTCWCFSFYLRFQETSSDLFVAACGGMSVVACAMVAVKARRQGVMNRNPREATWYWVLAWTMFCAWLLGIACGEMIFRTYMQGFYEVSSLNTYAGISPGKTSGGQVLDAGAITFIQGTYLDRMWMASYKEGDTYCVSPIVPASKAPYVDEGANGTTQELRLASYDFWAVGKNCCGDQTHLDFLCGEYHNPYARSGLRAIISESEKAHYKNAVKQAERNFGIRARQPLFLYWMQDPITEVTNWQDAGFKCFLGASLTFFGMQFCVVVLSLASLLKDYVA